MITAMDGTGSVGDASNALLRFEGRAMASPLRLAVHGLAPTAAEATWAAVREEFEACEAAMSRFRETSELTALNRASLAGDGLPIGDRLRRALVAAERARRITDGRFEPRLLRDLDRLGYRGVPVGSPGAATGSPEPAAGTPGPAGAPGPTGRAGAFISAGRILELGADGRVRLTAPVDLGGIGKGLALRWAAALVRRALPPAGGALLEAGGDIVAIGPGPEGEAWLVGVEDPAGGPTPLAVAALLDAAIATSSVAVHRWTAPSGERVHHLVDPGTGRPGGDGLLAVTVLGPDPAWAEVRTKQLFLAGSAAVGALARTLGLAAWWVTEDGSLAMTPGARLVTAWSLPRR